MIRKSLTTIALAAVTAFGASLPAQAEKPTLRVYNWSDYIAEDTVPNFTKQTGVPVTYDVFDSNEVLEGKLLAGHTGYDVVVPSAYFLERQIKAGVFQKLDKAMIPNFKGLDPKLMKQLAKVDPGNQYGVPYMWGTTGIGYNVKEVEKRLGKNAPTDSWKLIFDPKYVSKLKDCGVSMLDAPTDVVPAALHYLGLDPNSKNPADYEKAFALLEKVRPYIRYFHSSQYINDLANGNICVAIGWSGDVFQARDRADEAKHGVEIAYVIPKEGAQVWFDMLAVPADAPHPKEAFQFINYLLSPKVEAANTNYISYANPVPGSLKYVEKDIKDDPAIYPPPAVMDKLYTYLTPQPKINRIMTRLWTKLKTGT